MFISINNHEKNSVFLDTVIYQYNFACNYPCQECYISKSNARFRKPSIIDELKYSIENKELDCNEFIISLSSKPTYWEDVGKINELIEILSLNNIHTRLAIKKFEDLIRLNTNFIDSISISSLDGLEKCNQLTIYNCSMFDHRIFDKENYIDSIYCILWKQNIFDETCVLLEELYEYQEMIKKLIGRKIAIRQDRCVYGPCIAGRESVHIWPDGTVTACPYDYELKTSGQGDSIVDRIISCGKNYKLPRCYFNKNRKEIIGLLNE